MELVRFHNRRHRVIYQKYTFSTCQCSDLIVYSYLYYRLLTTILAYMSIEGLDVKALRAFRVLRPLRLVSGVPSKRSIL